MLVIGLLPGRMVHSLLGSLGLLIKRHLGVQHVLTLSAHRADDCSLLLVSVGCAVKPGSHAEGANPILGGGISDELDALAIVDPEVYAKVEDSVDSAKFKMYGGDPVWQRTWIDVGEPDVGLRDFCERMAARDPATFDKIHTDWVAWEAFVAAGTVPT